MNRLSDDARVSVERSLPKVVAEHHDRLSTARRVDLRIIKTPQRRADAEHVEVASGCDETASGARLVPDPNREGRVNLRGNVGEDAGRRIAIREIAIVSKRARAEVVHLTRALASLLNLDEGFRIGHRHRAQDERFDGAQHDRGGAQSDGENRDDRRAESGRFLERARGEADVGVEPRERAGDSLDEGQPRLLTLATLGREPLDRRRILAQALTHERKRCERVAGTRAGDQRIAKIARAAPPLLGVVCETPLDRPREILWRIGRADAQWNVGSLALLRQSLGWRRRLERQTSPKQEKPEHAERVDLAAGDRAPARRTSAQVP